jgi:hypothetical protein
MNTKTMKPLAQIDRAAETAAIRTGVRAALNDRERTFNGFVETIESIVGADHDARKIASFMVKKKMAKYYGSYTLNVVHGGLLAHDVLLRIEGAAA